MRDRLIELLNKQRNGKKKVSMSCEEFADFLLANGVIVQAKGHWTIKTDDYDCEYMVCSCCGEELYNADEDTIDRTPKYCPECGAKMSDVIERSNENAE